VAVRDGSIDRFATEARRSAIRCERTGKNQSFSFPPTQGRRDGADMRVAANGRFECRCGADFGSAAGNWKAHAVTRVVPDGAYGPHVRLHAELELREHACGACGTLHESEVVRKDEPSLVTHTLVV